MPTLLTNILQILSELVPKIHLRNILDKHDAGLLAGL